MAIGRLRDVDGETRGHAIGRVLPPSDEAVNAEIMVLRRTSFPLQMAFQSAHLQDALIEASGCARIIPLFWQKAVEGIWGVV